MNPRMLEKVRSSSPVGCKAGEKNHLILLAKPISLDSSPTCCRPPMLLITPAVDVLLNPVVGANWANSEAMLEFVIVAG
jgi:hypothetical protein